MKAKTILPAVLVVSILCGPAPAEWTEPVPVMEVNTEYAEWTPFLSFDGLSLYFARGHGPAFYDFRIFEATRPVPYGPFTSVGEISGTLNSSPGNVMSPWVSPDNLRMYYFTESNLVYDLKVTERTSDNDPWPVGINIPGLDTLGGRPQAPSLTADELIIVFSSYNAPGGVGGFDLWMATRPDKNSSFANVRNLTEINTAYKESKPYISPDGLTLYFPTDRNGSGQIFRATRASLNQPFGKLEHLSFFDAPRIGGHPSLSSDGTALYMAKTISGGEDIYVSYWIVDPYDDAVTAILDAIAEKLDALDKVNAALEEEWAAYEALQELLESGDYGDLSKGDIVTAMQKVHSSIQHEEQSMDALGKSIEKLQDALAALGCELPPPVSHWKFDEGSGTTAYDSVGANDGTVYGATWTTGQIKGALSFDGVDDYVNVIDCDNSLDIEDDITIAAWVKLDYFNRHDHDFFVGKQPTGTSRTNYPGNYIFRTTPLNGYIHFHHQTGTGDNEISKYSSTYGIAAGEWQHVSVTLVEGGNVNFYIDGSPAGTVPQLGTFGLLNDEPVRIGTRKDEWSYFNGLLDDIMIFNIALSAQEIQQLYNNGLAGL